MYLEFAIRILRRSALWDCCRAGSLNLIPDFFLKTSYNSPTSGCWQQTRQEQEVQLRLVCRWPEKGWVAELRVWVRSPVSLLYVMNFGESLVVSKGPKKLLCGWRAWTPTSTVCWSSQRFHPGQLGPDSVLHLDRVLVLRSHKTWHVSLSDVLKFCLSGTNRLKASGFLLHVVHSMPVYNLNMV